MVDEVELARRVADFLRAHPPDETDPLSFLRARFDAGLALVAFPEGRGGLGAPPVWQGQVDAAFVGAGAPGNRAEYNIIGLGMAAPTLIRYGTDEQCDRWLRSLWTGENIWCQLFSEPGAGSDLASLATSAVRDGDDWVVSGQKVWTSLAHEASWGLLLARSNPDLPKHRGLTYFACDMSAPGVHVRPLRQITGETEFNEVFLDDVRIPDAHRVGVEGEGWEVARATLLNERVTIGATIMLREGGPIGALCELWRRHPQVRRPAARDRLLSLWVRAEALRLTSIASAQAATAGQPGPEGSAAKLSQAAIAQESASLELDLLGRRGLRYDDWTPRRPDLNARRNSSYRYLRTRANSIEGGTSEIMRNIIAERVLGLPAEDQPGRDLPWREVPR